MLSFHSRWSDGGLPISRRTVLRLGWLGCGSLTLADWLRLRSLASPSQRPTTAVIHLFLGGGPSHLDMFDPKPLAPVEVRGEFQPIPTRLPGYFFSEHLPRLANSLDRLAVVRSITHGEASHLPASHWMVTGYRPPPGTTTNLNPYCGALTARLRGPNVPGMPAYASIPKRQSLGGAAYLGSQFNPFTTESDPAAEKFRVQNLSLAAGLDADRLQNRHALRRELDRVRDDVDRHGELSGFDRFEQEALELVTNARAQAAFDMEREDPATRDRYGRHPLGQRLLLARRLVEAGVTFVSVLSGGRWDTHIDNFSVLRDVSLPPLDQALAALVSDLAERNLDRQVLVLVSGEFGRTPTINRNGGRDHWPGAASVVFAGGGLPMGQVIGATDPKAGRPVTHPYGPGDVLATVYQFLGIDLGAEFLDASGRPMRVLPEGRPIAELQA